MIILAMTHTELVANLSPLKTLVYNLELDTSKVRLLVNSNDTEYIDHMERLHYAGILIPTTYNLDKCCVTKHLFNYDFITNTLKTRNAMVITTPKSLHEQFHLETVTELIRLNVLVHHLDGEVLCPERKDYLQSYLGSSSDLNKSEEMMACMKYSF